jgi:transcriptional regulator with XRE-family HTH domain
MRASRPETEKPSPDAGDRSPAVGANLRRTRKERGLSLSGLSETSGVSRAMLSQVELGRSTPTIHVLWKIARALNVPFSALLSDREKTQLVVLRASAGKVLISRDGSFRSRALFPFDGARSVEFYELRLLPGSVERAEAHPPRTTENLVVAAGALTVTVGGERHHLYEDDAIFFGADSPHEYRNDGEEAARAYLVMTYDRSEPRSSDA